MENDLDMKLYNEYLKGDKEAFEVLYNKYKSKIQYFVFNIVKDFSKAEDITQEVFIYILQDKFKKDCSFKSYLYMVAKSRAINFVNSEKNKNKIDETYLEKEEDMISEDIAEIITKNETRKEVLEAINKLEDKYKNALYLVKVEELSYKETAKILGKSEQNIKNLVHRGKKELKNILIKQGYGGMNKVPKVLLLIICIGVVTSGIVYGAVKIYEEIKSYYKEETVTEPISNSEAPVGEIVYKSFDVLKSEKDIKKDEWDIDSNTNLMYKKVTDFEEYKKLMKNFSNLRTLTEADFQNYFAFVILSDDVSNSLKYKFVTYDDSNTKEDPTMKINISIQKNENSDTKYSGLVVIITNRHVDYIIKPKLMN